MYRHISLFTLKNKEDKETFIEMLNKIGEECPSIVYSQVGCHMNPIDPNAPGPEFADVIQIIDFKDLEDLNNYPQTKEHMYLLENGPVMAKVSAIDYEY